MTCDEVTPLLVADAQRSAPLSHAARSHVAQCEDCQALAQALAHEDEETEAGAVSLPLVRPVCAVAPLPPTRVLVARTMLVFVALPAVAALLLGTDGLRAMRWWQAAASLGVIGASEILLSYALCALMVPGCRPRVPPAVLLVAGPVAFALASLAVFPATGASGTGGRCLAVGLGVAVPAGVWLTELARRGAVLDWGRAGAVVGLLSGLVGETVLAVRDPVTDGAHIALWHGAGVVGAEMAGAVLGRWLAARH